MVEASELQLDLTAAVALAGPGAASSRRRMLTRWRFVRGYVRRWRTDQVSVQVALYQFASEGGAAGFARDQLPDDTSSPQGGHWTTPTPIDGTENGVSMLLSNADSAGGSVTLGVAQVTDIAITVSTSVSTDQDPDIKDGNDLVVAQVKRLRPA